MLLIIISVSVRILIRDTIAVRRMADGYLKLLYPDGSFTKEEVEEVLQISMEMRRRVKEQLKKLGGMEFYDVNFSYIDKETFEEHYVSVPEQGGGKLIPEGMCNPGQVYTVSHGKSGMLGLFRLESQMLRVTESSKEQVSEVIVMQRNPLIQLSTF